MHKNKKTGRQKNRKETLPPSFSNFVSMENLPAMSIRVLDKRLTWHDGLFLAKEIFGRQKKYCFFQGIKSYPKLIFQL